MRYVIGLISLLLLSSEAIAGRDLLSDSDIRQKIIQQSISTYPGNCPCPFNRARNGSRCGKRSAWSRAGGYSPICYPNEISNEQVNGYRKSHKK